MDRLTELSTLIAVIDHGGFAPAARALRRSAPTVTRIVGELEARVGLRLLDRTSRRCAPTEQGRKLADSARSVIAEYEQAISAAAGEAASIRGPLRITAPYYFGRAHIAPTVIGFLALHELIEAELHLTDRVIDLHSEGFDLAVRIGPIADTSLIARRIGSVSRVIVASPAYLEQFGVPKRPSDLIHHKLVQHGSRSDLPWPMRSKTGDDMGHPVRAKFTVNLADSAVAAARSGHGLVNALSYQVHDDVMAGALRKVLEQFEPEPLPVQLAWPEGRDRLLRVRMLIDHLTDELRPLSVLHQ